MKSAWAMPIEEEFPEQHTEAITEVVDHPHDTDFTFENLQTYWWVIVIFVVGLAFCAKALWRIAKKNPFFSEILKMWNKT